MPGAPSPIPVLPPIAELPNPYNFPTKIEVEIEQGYGVVTTVHRFNDLQEAFLWARQQTGVVDFPQIPYGTYNGWDFTSFLFVKQELEVDPRDELEIFYKSEAHGAFTSYAISYDFQDEENEEELPPLTPVPILSTPAPFAAPIAPAPFATPIVPVIVPSFADEWTVSVPEWAPPSY